MFKGRALASDPNVIAQWVRDTEQFFVEVELEGRGLFSARDVEEENWEHFLPQGRHLQQPLRGPLCSELGQPESTAQPAGCGVREPTPL